MINIPNSISGPEDAQLLESYKRKVVNSTPGAVACIEWVSKALFCVPINLFACTSHPKIPQTMVKETVKDICEQHSDP